MITLDDNISDLPLNTHVVVTVTLERHSHLLTIPREALHTGGAEDFVFRVQNGRLVRTRVEPGLVNAMNVEITKGLAPEDVVALRAVNEQKLAENLKVTTVK